MSDSWNEIFNKIKPVLNKTMEEISEEILADWRELIWTEFYLSYTPSSYNRTHETIQSLGLLKINKTSNGIEITMGYDSSKIHTSQNGYWTSHEEPEKMGELIERGYIYGHDPDGIGAVDDMLKKINSSWFKNKFSALMKKKGYIVKF